MINKTILVGRITKDPEMRYTNSNIPYVRFTLAVNRTYTESNGERKADFISCVAWRNQAENMAKYINKGSLLGIEGRIQTGQYDDNNGVRRYTTDVVCDSVQFLEPKNASSNNQDYGQQQDGYYRQDQSRQNNNQTNQQRRPQQQTPEIDVAEDDLPF